jgi:glycosyltransferase involved in cell wall biosynthesis
MDVASNSHHGKYEHQHMQEEMNVWLLLDSSKPGGIESHVMQLASGLRSHGVAVSVVFLADHGKHPMKDALDKAGIDRRFLKGSFYSLVKALKNSKPALVHTHGYKAGILGRAAGQIVGIPVASTFHAGETGRGRMRFYDTLDRQTAKLASLVYAVSNDIANKLPAPSRVLDNFVDTRDCVTSSGDKIAFVGRLSHEKGPDRFVDLAESFPSIPFHVYGDGPLGDKLRQSAPANLAFHGQQASMKPLWSEIGLLVMPSRHEGMPMAALEAMSHGIPVIASKVGAMQRVVQDGSNGWLVNEGDMAALRDRLQLWLALDERQKNRMRVAASERIMSEFSVDSVIPEIIAGYRKITSSRRARVAGNLQQ